MTSAQKHHSRIRINLLYQQGLPQKLPIKFLNWLIVYGRFIVIFVEILVVAVFVARFKYDSDLGDLKDQINPQVSALESLSSDEVFIRRTQHRLTTIQDLTAKSPKWKNMFTTIARQVPQGAKITNISFQKNASGNLQVKISAQANSNRDLAALANGLKEEPDFLDIDIPNISVEQGQIVFTVTGAVKIQEGKK